MAKKVFRHGDVVTVTDLNRIADGELFFDEGDQTEVVSVGFLGFLPFVLVTPQKNLDHEKLHGKKVFPILLPEFEGLTLVRPSLEHQFEDSERAKRHGIDVGDKVRILNVENIMFGEMHFKNGDVTEVTELVFGHPVVKTPDSEDGLIIGEGELQYIAKVAN